jgi:beta-N-acetylhexosaminidase
MTLPGSSAPLPRAVLFGCEGEGLAPEEERFFASANPLGFILFRRNCRSEGQLRDLVAALRASVGREEVPVAVDQEGGPVARLKPPSWRLYPSAARLASLPDPRAEEAVRLCARLMADDLERVGVTVDLAPVLDLAVAGADPVIGERSYGGDPRRVARLGEAASLGLLEGGVLPVMKHIPGHGRARVDSHHARPVVDAPRDELSRTDFAPFRALKEEPWAMTAHIVFSAIDAAAPATFSPKVIAGVIRAEIGFDGVLLSDDLSMGALDGPIEERAQTALAAGCDLVLHCNANRRERDRLAAATPPLSARTAARIARAEALRRSSRAPSFDREAAEARFEALLAERSAR